MSTLSSLEPTTTNLKESEHHFTNDVREGSFRRRLWQASKLPEGARQYSPGDPVRLIDWKAYAKTDQLIIRENRNYSQVKTLLVLDANPGMEWPTEIEIQHAVTKFEIAVRIVLFLAYQHFRAGDKVTILVLDDTPKLLDLRSGADCLAMFTHMEGRAFQRSGLTPFLTEAVKLDTYQNCHVYHWIGDLLRHTPDQWEFSQNTIPILYHVLSSFELDISWLDTATNYRFDRTQGMEYSGQYLVKQSQYYDRIDEWIDRWTETITKQGGGYLTCYEALEIDWLHVFLGETLS